MSNYTVANWEKLLEIAQQNTSARRVRRPGQSPSTADSCSENISGGF